MNEKKLDDWLNETLPKQDVLTKSVINIMKNLLKSEGIDYLTITGRTKDKKSIKEKVTRKSYKEPDKQLTDLSGIRIILFFESDVKIVSKLIKKAFNIDKKNSLNKESLLAANEIGYRSVHYVCDLGKERTLLPEFKELRNLKFEFQIRTILQHAWAELAHDRNYKFKGKLPPKMERKLFLYSGMLELADKGFDELSNEIDTYTLETEHKIEKGNLNIEINSITIEEFINKWSTKNNYPIINTPYNIDKTVEELKTFGIISLDQLEKIIPKNFVENSQKIKERLNLTFLVRDWMLIYDYKKYKEKINYTWTFILSPDIFKEYFTKEEFNDFKNTFPCLDQM